MTSKRIRRAVSGRENLIAGVNCRDLDTLDVVPERHAALAGQLPGDVVCVAESAMQHPADIERVATYGYRAALIGSALMRTDDPASSGQRDGRGRSSGRDGALMTLFVKLCGVKSEADLEAAVAAGADAVGFVLTPSPRQISLNVAARLNARLPDSVLGVAVFHDPSPDLLVRAGEEVGPDLFQSELSTLVGISTDQLLPVVVDGESLDRDFALAAASAGREMVLVDSAARGGTGLTPRWERLARLDGPGRLILAGGLDPDNVGEAVSLVRPFGVDVSSGIERAPGVKDPKRMKAFVEAARSVGVGGNVMTTARDETGRYGRFGGRYVPEILVPALTRLEETARLLLDDPGFLNMYEEELSSWVGRPTAPHPCRPPR